jgi:hypothetical protein
MPIKFKDRTKHDRLDIMPGVSVAFEDDRAEEYFIAAEMAEETDDEPVVTYPEGSVTIDPETTRADTGARVLEA